MTLMEIIIAITLISIIALAAFHGMQFAFYALSATDAYMEDVYVLQTEMEKDLSLAYVVDPSTDASSIPLGSGTISASDETIHFSWPVGSGLTDFQTTGVTVERDAEGGDYLEDHFYIFIPVTNTDQ